MRSKNFKIGEYAIGGIISIQKDKNFVTIQALDYNTKKPASPKIQCSIYSSASYSEVLHELTSSYYAEKIIEFIES